MGALARRRVDVDREVDADRRAEPPAGGLVAEDLRRGQVVGPGDAACARGADRERGHHAAKLLAAGRDGPRAPRHVAAAGRSARAVRAEGELDRYINARNTASGALKQLDARITASRPLTMYAFGST